MVAQARDRCSPIDVVIVQGLLLDGSSVEAMAAALGIPEDDVRSRLASVMVALRASRGTAGVVDAGAPRAGTTSN
jgi:DNA-directed RNA polymerase specialized sigma24 family protein